MQPIKERLDELHDMLTDFQNDVLQGELGDDDDRAIQAALDIIEEYL